MRIIVGKEGHLSQYYNHIVPKKVAEYLKEQGDQYVAQIDTEELVKYLCDLYALPLLEFDPERTSEVKQIKKEVELQDGWGRSRRTEQNHAEVTVYFKPVRNLEMRLKVQASFSQSERIDADFNSSEYSITFTTPLWEWELKSKVAYLEDMMKNGNPEIQQFNQNLPSIIRHSIERRKQELSNQDKEFEQAIQKVNIPLKRVDKSKTPLVNLRVRKSIEQLKRPIVNPKQEFELGRAYVIDILDLIKQSAEQFEINPSVYGTKLDEPDLRSIILSHLNMVFEGSATGETFSNHGKTDIYLNISQGQIFIAECKFWSGLKAYGDHIDQLFRYLTWRRNYAAILTFSRNRGFTQVLSNLEQAIKDHPTYIEDFTKLSDTHFQSIHTFPEDNDKKIEIHHLVSNLYSEPS